MYVRETFLYYVTQLACSPLERIPRISNSPSFFTVFFICLKIFFLEILEFKNFKNFKNF